MMQTLLNRTPKKYAVLGWIGLGLVACSGDDGKTAGGGDSMETSSDSSSDTTGTPHVRCTKDATALASGPYDCRNNRHCLCGSHCVLGECVYECLTDADCTAGTGCDDWGVCRTDHASVAPPTMLEPSPALGVTPPYIRLVDGNTERRLVIRTLSEEDGPLKIKPSDGLWVRCGDSGEFSQDGCTAEAASTLAVWVKADPSAAKDAVHEVWIFHGNTVKSVGVALSDTPITSTGWTIGESADNPAAKRAAPLVTGLYDGQMWIEAAGIGDKSAGDPAVPEDFRFAVSLTVYDGPTDASYVALLQDPLHMLIPGGAWITTLTADGNGTYTWNLPPLRLTEAPESMDDPEILMAGSALGFMMADGVGSATVELQYPGVVALGEPISATFQMALVKTRDLTPDDGDTPELPVPAAAAYPSLEPRVTTPFAWEMATTTEPLLGPGATIETVMATFDEWVISNPPNLYPCERKEFDAELTSLLGIVCENYWQTSASGPSLANAGLAGAVSTFCAAASGAGFIPCAIGIEKHAENVDPTAYPPGLNECEAMEQKYGCSVGSPAIFQNTMVYTANGNPKAIFSAPKVCTFPHLAVTEKPGLCAARTLCFVAPEEGGDSASLATGEWDGKQLATSGDLRCTNEAGETFAPLGFGLFTNADQPTGGIWDGQALPRKSVDMIPACIADLERFAAAPPAVVGDGGAGLGVLFQSEGCFDGPRTIRALSWALHTDRLRALGKSDALSESGSALAHRLLQQWLYLHTYVTRETLQARTLAEMLALGPAGQAQVAAFPELADLIKVSHQAWGLVLHPRLGSAFAATPQKIAQNPDYRPYFTDEPLMLSNDYEQPKGASAAMLDLYVAQLRVSLALLERALFLPSSANVQTARDSVDQSIRLLIPVLALANRMRAQAGDTVPWETAWKSAKTEINMAIKTVLSRLDQLDAGKNPLGIEDRDLPIYFYGDPAGASAQFSAISDYLVGDGTGQGEFTAWAAATVSKAQDALDAARAAWLETVDRDLAEKLQVSEYEGQMDNIKGNYAGTILGLCGAPQYDLNDTPEALIEKWGQYTAQDCWLVGSGQNEAPSPCVADATTTAKTLINALPVDDIAYRLCYFQQLRAQFGNMVSPYGMESLDYLVKFGSGKAKPPLLDEGAQKVTVEFDTGGKKVLSVDEFLTLLFRDPAPQIDYAKTQAARTLCGDLYPDATPLLSLSELVGDPLDKAECYRGSVGETALAVRSAAKDVEIARSQLSELSDSFDIAMQACILQQAGNETLEAALISHNKSMSYLKAGKLTSDLVAIAAGGLSNAMTAYATGLDPVSKIFGGVAAGAAAAEAVANGVSTGLEFAMDKAQTEFDQTMVILENDISEKICFTEAQAQLVGARTAGLEVQKAMQELAAAQLALSNGIVEIDGFLWCGPIEIQRLMGRTVLPLNHTLWLDERLQTYQRAFRIAQRTLYLGVRAIEYEYQTSLSQREQVLSARTPADLQAVLTVLWEEAASRTIDGKKPKTGHLVVSLKNDLWHIPPDEPLGPALVDPARRTTLEDGQTGQKFEFFLAPGGGDQQGTLEVFAAADCAERLWFTSAILTGEGLFEGDDRTFVNIQLRQQNTFFSQWCSNKGGDTDYQDVSVRPSRNLFRDPLYGTDSVTAQATSSETLSYTTARLEAYMNQTRADLEAADYAQGISGELAGRGLYGRYELFIPTPILYGIDKDGKSNGKGLRLEHVDDIFIRFDYVSVAK